MSKNYMILPDASPLFFEGNRIGILVSHGFTGTTQSMKPLGEAYAEKGYTVCVPRLLGHGTHYLDMEASTYRDWVKSIEEGYHWLKERCDIIFVTGLSMGGTLTLYMAETYPDIKGIIPINAAIDIPMMADVAAQSEVRFLDAIGSDIKKPNVKELAYEKTPTKSIQQIVQLMKVVKEDLSKVTCPTLIFVSKEDHVVPPDNSQLIFEHISSKEKELIELKNSYHVATLDNDQQIIIENTLQFINRIIEK
ncbi:MULTISPECIES: alpha/beta hydrolase [Heyndrickxia]|uniref:Lipase n=1 Tax=Heyndrickxia oleronia TaxID=38875 RepID=A0A8E2LCS6_9BACI|nr:alpha/beta fold hydrolase [Heyndrickxia oleronia]OJH19308.1 lipase [Bacillus obstructivus]MCI1593032.1 alpha/beta hydrolase [Heyndrickxia oleronia]MCI1615759.1 alpha/beta hydrolase [Heyndrickxia oleronia]MCI1764084.1 alpha/beta hydrolase [Heyndrickxia oleronia]MEC1375754.1 alpha/beta hydrolase [Heyndrickxia oleronia]